MGVKKILIYKVTNKINKKIYIGQTTLTLNQRQNRHRTTFYHQRAREVNSSRFYNAIGKYGFDNFKFEEIEKCDTLESLDEREMYWIQFYKSHERKFGYNIKLGGNTAPLPKSIRDKIGKKTKDRWKDPEQAKLMLEGLKKGTKKWQDICQDNRATIYCQVCNKAITNILPCRAKIQKTCSYRCSSKLGIEKAKIAREALTKEKKEEIESMVETLFFKLLEDAVLEPKEIVKIIGDNINRKDHRTIIRYITRGKGQTWIALKEYIDEQLKYMPTS